MNRTWSHNSMNAPIMFLYPAKKGDELPTAGNDVVKDVQAKQVVQGKTYTDVYTMEFSVANYEYTSIVREVAFARNVGLVLFEYADSRRYELVKHKIK